MISRGILSKEVRRLRLRLQLRLKPTSISISTAKPAKRGSTFRNNIHTRAFSTSFEYEFPTRTEAPRITRSVASSLSDESNTTGSTNDNNFLHRLPTEEQSSILAQQQHNLPLKTSLPDSFTIRAEPPSFIPSNLPPDSLSTPTTQISTLANGLRVASQETYGQVCTFGIISDAGSRLETASNPSSQFDAATSNANNANTGVNHLMELLAFCGTKNLDSTTYQNALDSLGGVSFASSSKEQFLYCIDVLRPNVDQAMHMLQDVVLNPLINDAVVDDMKRVIEFQWMDIVPEIILTEGLQMAAYGNIDGNHEQQQLGKPHFCPLEALPNLNAQTTIDFRNKYLLNPKSMVVAGAGIEHEHLVSLAEQYFGHLQPSSISSSNNGIIESIYTGGSHKQTLTTQDGFTKIALAFPTGGWHSKDLVPSCVLQTLLGGGSSFSAGGPGKGMYSRLYRQVLNRYYWAESCEAFTAFHSESGLLGISGSTTPTKAGDMTQVLVEHFMRLAMDYVEDEELDRARNMLKCNVLTQLESRLVLFEDVGRQILTYDKREGSHEMCEKIDAVTKDDIRNLAKKSIIGMKPTLCAVGDDVRYVPEFENVEKWFQTLS